MAPKEPYIPRMEDCRMAVRTNEATCCIMDTCCRDITDHRRAEIDHSIFCVYRQAALKKLAEEREYDQRHP